MGRVYNFGGGPTRRDNNSKYSFEDIAKRLASNAEAFCQKHLSGGEVIGQEYVCADLSGGKGRSLAVRIRGDRAGVWKDFQSGETGADLINLLAAQKRIGQGDAKELAEEWLGLASDRGVPERRVEGKPAAPANDTPDEEDELWWRRERPTKKWYYTDADGVVVGTVYRFEHPKSGKKVIRPWNGSRWEAPEGDRPLLYLDELLHTSGPIVLVEGEKCADAVREAGYAATTIMGGAQALSKTDFSPLEGRDVILWRDNDDAGKSWSDKLTEELREVGAASVRLLPAKALKGKPEKWDAADADLAERKRLVELAEKERPVVTGKRVLRLAEWGTDQFDGAAPERQYLVKEVLPLGKPVVLAAQGDTGKGMMLLDLALKVAGGQSKPVALQPTAFGCDIATFGTVVLFSAEDDQDELHQRIARLDPRGDWRKAAGKRLIIVPLPNTGGMMQLVTSGPGGVATTPEWDRIRDQLLAIEKLRLVIFDPLSPFVGGDLNKDGALTQVLGSLFAGLATETGATVVISHHMRKPPGNITITTPEQARDAIRGQAGIVDGVRAAYTLWPAGEKEAKEVLKALAVPGKEEDWRNKVVKGAVVKSNGPADRRVRTYLRAASGLLEDVTFKVQHEVIERIQVEHQRLTEAIKDAAAKGYPFTKTGGSTGIYVRRSDLPPVLRKIGRNRLWEMVDQLLEEGVIVQCRHTGQEAKWLDTPDGPFATGQGELARGAQEGWEE